MFGIPQRILTFLSKDLFFLDGPKDYSIRLEICCPNTLINITKVCCVWLTHHSISI